MEQSPSAEANIHSANQEISCLLWNPKVHYRVHNSTPLVPWARWIQSTPPPPFPYSNIIFPYTPIDMVWYKNYLSKTISDDINKIWKSFWSTVQWRAFILALIIIRVTCNFTRWKFVWSALAEAGFRRWISQLTVLLIYYLRQIYHLIILMVSFRLLHTFGGTVSPYSPRVENVKPQPCEHVETPAKN
jgi:hypothetical protein